MIGKNMTMRKFYKYLLKLLTGSVSRSQPPRRNSIKLRAIISRESNPGLTDKQGFIARVPPKCFLETRVSVWFSSTGWIWPAREQNCPRYFYLSWTFKTCRSIEMEMIWRGTREWIKTQFYADPPRVRLDKQSVILIFKRWGLWSCRVGH